MNQPLISVVIPFYNHIGFINTAYDNLNKQTIKDWELVFVNNNSSDGSFEKALELAETDKRVKVITENKQGIAFARNAGLRVAQGTYITFLDVDDEFTNNKFEVLLPLFDTYPEIAFAYGLTRRVYLPEGNLTIQDKGVVAEGVNQAGSLAADWIGSLYRLPQTGSSLAKTEVIREIGGFDENLTLGNDDVGYHLKLAFNYPIGFVNKETVIYYRHQKSAGAKLNESVTVHFRYFEAYYTSALPLAIKYKQTSGDSNSYRLALRHSYSNLLELVYSKKDRRSELKKIKTTYKLRMPFYYGFMIALFPNVNYKIIRIGSKILYRLLK